MKQETTGHCQAGDYVLVGSQLRVMTKDYNVYKAIAENKVDDVSQLCDDNTKASGFIDLSTNSYAISDVPYACYKLTEDLLTQCESLDFIPTTRDVEVIALAFHLKLLTDVKLEDINYRYVNDLVVKITEHTYADKPYQINTYVNDDGRVKTEVIWDGKHNTIIYSNANNTSIIQAVIETIIMNIYNETPDRIEQVIDVLVIPATIRLSDDPKDQRYIFMVYSDAKNSIYAELVDNSNNMPECVINHYDNKEAVYSYMERILSVTSQLSSTLRQIEEGNLALNAKTVDEANEAASDITTYMDTNSVSTLSLDVSVEKVNGLETGLILLYNKINHLLGIIQ